MFFAGSVVLTFFLLFVEFIHAGVYVTLPSAYGGCGSLQSDSYFWDTLDDPNSVWNEPLNYYSTSVPKGTYYFYGPNMPPGSQPFYPSDIKQYFCTGLVDEMTPGSYCFYQNIQNCNFSFCITFFLNLLNYPNEISPKLSTRIYRRDSNTR